MKLVLHIFSEFKYLHEWMREYAKNSKTAVVRLADMSVRDDDVTHKGVVFDVKHEHEFLMSIKGLELYDYFVYGVVLPEIVCRELIYRKWRVERRRR